MTNLLRSVGMAAAVLGVFLNSGVWAQHSMMEGATENAVRQGSVMLGDTLEIHEGSFIKRLSENRVAIENLTSVGNPTSGTFQCGCKGGGEGCTLKQGANVLSCEKGEGSSCGSSCQFQTTIQVGPPGSLGR